MKNTTEIYIQLLEEGTPTARPTPAIALGNGLFKVLPTERYNPDIETWEFLPGTVVKCEDVEGVFGKMLLAVEKID